MARSRCRNARRWWSGSCPAAEAIAAGGLLLAALALPAAAQGTRELRGRLVAPNRASVDGIALRFAGYGETVTARAGEFVIEIPAGITRVPVVLVDSPWRVLSPADGQVLVPLGANEQVTIVIGEPVERIVLKALAEWKRQLDESKQRDAAEVDVLTGRIKEVLDKLGVKPDDLNQQVELRRRQAEAYPPIAAAVNGYVLEARDLRNALAALQGLIEKNPREAFKTLETAVGDYNKAYTELSTHADGFAAAIEGNWPDGKLARRDFEDFFRNTADQTHQTQFLPLNALLVKIQAALFSGKRDAGFKEALLDLSRRVDVLGPSVATIGDRAGRTLEKL